MKIDAYRSDPSLEALDRAGKPAVVAGNRDAKGSTATPAGGDEVRLSDDARLLQSVMQSAQQAMPIRQDVVDRVRAALANGTVGSDPHALADAILDRMIGTSQRES